MIKHGVPQGSTVVPILFLLYINDLPAVVNQKAIPVLFADDTIILFTPRNTREFHMNIDTVFGNVNTWLKTNCLSLNIEKLTTYTLRQRTANLLT